MRSKSVWPKRDFLRELDAPLGLMLRRPTNFALEQKPALAHIEKISLLFSSRRPAAGSRLRIGSQLQQSCGNGSADELAERCDRLHSSSDWRAERTLIELRPRDGEVGRSGVALGQGLGDVFIA